MSRKSYSMFKILGVEGIKVNILPTTKGMNATEIYNKKSEYLGIILFDDRRGWKQYVLADLDSIMQMSLDCLKEAFEMTEEYWRKNGNA